MRLNRQLLVLVALLLGLAGWAGHGLRQRLKPLSQAHAAGAGSLTLLSPHPDAIRQEIGEAFVDWHALNYGTSAQVRWLDMGGTSEALRYLEARYRQNPAKVGVDLFFGGGPPPFLTLAQSGYLVPRALDSATLAALPQAWHGQKLQAPEQGWYGVCLSGFGIVFHRALLRQAHWPEPKAFADLAAPHLLGKIAFIDPRGSGSAHVIYEILLQHHGFEKGFGILARMAANASVFTRGASQVLPFIANGEAVMAVAIDQYGWSLVAEHGPETLGFTLPAGERVLTPDPIALLQGAPNPELAKRFMTFVLSDAGQKLWLLKPGEPQGPQSQGLHRLPIRPSAYAGVRPEQSLVTLRPFDDADAQGRSGYRDSLTSARWVLINDLLGLYLVDAHADAQKAWRACIEVRSATPDCAGPWFTPPAPWDSLAALLPKWADAAFRNRTLAQWERHLHAAP